MTDTTTTRPVQPEAGVLEQLVPAGLVIETNVRAEGLVLDAEFVDSVRTHGVLVPALGWRHTGGAAHVRAGPRRTLAAREAQVAANRVDVVQADDDSTAVWIVEGLVENEHRQTFTNSDRVAAWRRTEWALLSPHVRAGRSDALRECIREAAGVPVPRSILRCPPRSRRWGQRRVSGVLPCPGLPSPRCGFRTTLTQQKSVTVRRSLAKESGPRQISPVVAGAVVRSVGWSLERDSTNSPLIGRSEGLRAEVCR